jgi:uncharacterized membrane protein YtjA (UPF0391 family)
MKPMLRDCLPHGESPPQPNFPHGISIARKLGEVFSMSWITSFLLLLLVIVAALFAFGVIFIPAASIAKVLFGLFLFLLIVELLGDRKRV